MGTLIPYIRPASTSSGYPSSGLIWISRQLQTQGLHQENVENSSRRPGYNHYRLQHQDNAEFRQPRRFRGHVLLIAPLWMAQLWAMLLSWCPNLAPFLNKVLCNVKKHINFPLIFMCEISTNIAEREIWSQSCRRYSELLVSISDSSNPKKQCSVFCLFSSMKKTKMSASVIVATHVAGVADPLNLLISDFARL